MEEDFYATLATHWGILRREAKFRALWIIYGPGESPWADTLPPEWRAELWRRCGFILGEN